jgi:glycine hydroxymethyltransferase
MYLFRKFVGERFDRLNALVDDHARALTTNVNLIASACYPFPEVLQALSYPMSAMPLEGSPERRYFPGCGVMDEVEAGAEQHLRSMFRLTDAYRATIQPHSGTQANQIVFNAVLRPDDVVLSFKPSHGGHVSHTVLVGRRNKAIHYGLTAAGSLDYDQIASLAEAHRPRLIVGGGSSYPHEIDYGIIAKIAAGVGAFTLADISHTALFVAAGTHRSIFPEVDFASFTMNKNLRGPGGGILVYRDAMHDGIQSAIFPGTQGGPIENSLFAKFTALEMLSKVDLATYARAIVSRACILIAAFGDAGIKVTSASTDTHIVLLDLRGTGLTGGEAEKALERSHVFVNRNQIPDDPRPPHVASGVRLGSSDEDTYALGRAVADVLLGRPEASAVVVDRLLRKYGAALSTSSGGS